MGDAVAPLWSKINCLFYWKSVKLRWVVWNRRTYWWDYLRQFNCHSEGNLLAVIIYLDSEGREISFLQLSLSIRNQNTLFFLQSVHQKNNTVFSPQNTNMPLYEKKMHYLRVFKKNTCLQINHNVNSTVEGRQYFNRGRHTVNPAFKLCRAR